MNPLALTQGYTTTKFFLSVLQKTTHRKRLMAGILQKTVIVLGILAVFVVAPAPAAESVGDYTITYTISVQEDGSALWQVEYRTLLATDTAAASFEEYATTISAEGLPQFRQLIERSASQATIANSRPMAVSDFKGTADIQTSPTGRFGVVLYSFSWKGFAEAGQDLVIGDAFAGGMYLPRDATLIIRYPAGYSVKRAEPAADRSGDSLTWYGVRSFGSGEPTVILAKESLPVTPILAALVLVIVVVAAGVFVIARKKSGVQPPGEEEPDLPGQPALLLTDAEIHSLSEQITATIRSAGGEMYQSEIVKTLGLPKSTVSSALNAMHARGLIVKVKKGRENLIRFTEPAAGSGPAR